MKIIEVQWHPYRLPLRSSFSTAHGAMSAREGIIVLIATERGISGVGEIAPLPDFGGGSLADIRSLLPALAARLHGKTLDEALDMILAESETGTKEPERPQADESGQPQGSPLLYTEGAALAPPALSAPALCGLESALLDALGKAEGCRVCNLLAPEGAVPPAAVPVNAVIGAVAAHAARAAAQQARNTGYRCIKLKVGAAVTRSGRARLGHAPPPGHALSPSSHPARLGHAPSPGHAFTGRFVGRASSVIRRGGSGGDVGRGRLRRPPRPLNDEPLHLRAPRAPEGPHPLRISTQPTRVRPGHAPSPTHTPPRISIQAEIERIAAVRDAIGPAMHLRLDANEAWTLEEAIAILSQCVQYDIQYVEQPLPAHDLAGMHALRQAVPIPIAVDEALHGLESAQRVLDYGAADILVIKPQLAGGLWAGQQIIQAAAERGVRSVITSTIETGIGLAAALHLAAASPAVTLECGLATLPLLVDDLVLNDLPVRDGFLTVPTGAGLGVALDLEALHRYRFRGDD